MGTVLKIDDGDLLVYVDGGLAEPMRAIIERELRVTPEVARKVAWLRASRFLPYQDAFEQEPMAPVPAGLVAAVSALARRG